MIRFFSERSAAEPVGARSRRARISRSGLEAARDALERDGIERGAILLASDLEFFPDDVARLTATLTELRADGNELRILPLGAREEQRRFFERSSGRESSSSSPTRRRGGRRRGSGRFRLAEEDMPWLFARAGAGARAPARRRTSVPAVDCGCRAPGGARDTPACVAQRPCSRSQARRCSPCSRSTCCAGASRSGRRTCAFSPLPTQARFSAAVDACCRSESPSGPSARATTSRFGGSCRASRASDRGAGFTRPLLALRAETQLGLAELARR